MPCVGPTALLVSMASCVSSGPWWKVKPLVMVQLLRLLARLDLKMAERFRDSGIALNA